MMKKTLSLLASLAVLGCVYFLSFKSAHVRQSSDSTHLVILGIKLPYNHQTGRLFSTFYSPLLNYRVAKEPLLEVSGTIESFDPATLELVLLRPNKTTILLYIPPKMRELMKSFAHGAVVQVTYKYRPKRENPHIQIHFTESIKPIAQSL